jgi:hypothetical protein
MTKWIPLAVTLSITLLTAIFTPQFVAAHPTLFLVFNALAQVLHAVLPSTITPSAAVKTMLLLTLVFVMCCAPAFAQTPAPSPTPFSSASVSFGLTPIVVPGYGQTLAGAETDTLFSLTTNNLIGPTVLVSGSSFIGGRYNRVFPSVSTWLQKHTALTGTDFQVGFTASAGVVETGKSQWGGRGGFFVNYALNNTWAMGFEAQANYLPGIATNGKWAPSIAVGPNFHF